MNALVLLPMCIALLNDVGLCVAFDRASTPAARSRHLVDLSRRSGPVVVAFLTRKHDELVAARQANGNRVSLADSTVELLTALRRAEGRPDPAAVVASVPGEVESIFPNLPAVEAALVNRDVQKTPVTFKKGGDYRTGRQDRWRFNVLDVRGKAMPVKLHRGTIYGGGIFTMGVLKHEESWETVLHMRKFIDLPPGDYTVSVEYHDEETIADRPDTAGLLVCRSEPFKLHVQPRVIDVAKKDREAAREAIASLSDKGPVQILDGAYGKGAYDFIQPDSAAGRLLALGWRAVPTLLDELDNDRAADQRQAWVFAILYSITGWNDPRHDRGVLAGYESRGGVWSVSGGMNGKAHVMGLGLGGRTSVSGGKFDGAAQKAFAKEWKAVREYLVVREKP
jgi:hypothetical protein